ncbi:hypothetical protein AOLI_G00040820 [Acnodon oligacanthus]
MRTTIGRLTEQGIDGKTLNRETETVYQAGTLICFHMEMSLYTPVNSYQRDSTLQARAELNAASDQKEDLQSSIRAAEREATVCRDATATPKRPEQASSALSVSLCLSIFPHLSVPS